MEILCKDSAGVAVPLAGWKAYAEVRAKPLAPLILNLTPTIQVADTLGKVTLPAKAPALTAPLPPGDYLWELVLEDAAGKRLPPLLGGSMKVKLTLCDAVNFPSA